MTFSILSHDPRDGSIGLASQSHFFGVGSVVGTAEPGVGAVVSQAFANTDWPPAALAALRAGRTPQDIVDELVQGDPWAAYRQVAVMDATGRHATFTGGRCVPQTGTATGPGVVAVGNMLADPGVCAAMVAAHDASPGPAERRLVAALAAGERAGGDARGSQSAYLRVVGGARTDRPWREVRADIRVDDAPDPIGELARLLPIQHGFRAVGATLFTPGVVIGTPGELDPATDPAGFVDLLTEAVPDLGDNREAALWRAVVLLRFNEPERGGRELAALLADRPSLGPFVRALAEVGILAAADVQDGPG
ncbi:DUF1028 domain-containing protein [Spongiactinospora rosea]|uniref:DUF1028 domain-containing protein n=1 Tax=Spongiactinospora rosea TaxID=2248750 RepID=A0A366LM06_9ACTN|nr:DUF1028 domain-containing protein [Spongiactinospora rosea]RBQ14948.1 DUF1028 domain-containing protein [Spongiactinospora rosea]